MSWFSKKSKTVTPCSHEKYSYKYNSDNEELYICDNCSVAGVLTGGEEIPNSFNMITMVPSYKDQVFKPLTISDTERSK